MKKIVSLTLMQAGFLVMAQTPIPVQHNYLEVNQAEKSKYKTDLTLESIFSEGYFGEERIGAMQWLPDGKSYSVVELTPEGSVIVQIDIQTGNRKVLVEASQLISQETQKTLRVESYQFTDDMKRVMIFTNSVRVWRYNTKGDYYFLDIANGKLTKVAPKAEASMLQFAKLSPTGDKIAYVYKHNLYVQDLNSDRITSLTSDGTEEVINGTFDWAYEEEFDCRDGFRWSPDGTKIAFWQIDARGIGVFNMINYTDSIYSKTIPLQYPKVGTTISAARIGVVNVDGGVTVWMNVPGDERNNYLPYMDWADNSNELFIQQIPRKQTHNTVYLGDVMSGGVRKVMTDGSENYWIDVNDNVVWFNKGCDFLWLSEEDGWKHIYLVSRNGEKRLLTPGNYDVMRINYIDNVKGYVYFTTSMNNPLQRFLFRVKSDGGSQPEQLCPEFKIGTHNFNIAPGAGYAIHSYTSSGIPTKSDLVDLKRNKVVRSLVKNEVLNEKLEALELQPQEFIRVETEPGVVLDGWMVKPKEFDASKKYPVIFHVYGEPAGTTVTDAWGGAGYLYHQYLAQEGFIVMSIENRGTPVPRGVEFRKHVYKKIGISAPQDQANAVKKLLDTYSYLDAGRVGVWGWSGGGSMTLNALLKYPDLYKVGVAVASVPDQKLYNAFYQERFMLHPDDNKEGYYEGSPVNFAKNLKGKLMIIHGTGDDNVHYQGAERMFNALIKEGKQFDMFVYPNRAHGIYEGEGTTIHLRHLITDYFKRNL